MPFKNLYEMDRFPQLVGGGDGAGFSVSFCVFDQVFPNFSYVLQAKRYSHGP